MSLLKVLVNSVKPFSFVSTTTSFEGEYCNIAFIKDEPIVPAPPMTRTDFSLISFINFFSLLIMSFSKKLSLFGYIIFNKCRDIW